MSAPDLDALWNDAILAAYKLRDALAHAGRYGDPAHAAALQAVQALEGIDLAERPARIEYPMREG